MRSEYSAADLVRVAGRWNNAKRNYLLVDPLQAKHVPCRPEAAIGLMSELGDRIREAAPGCRLVIGFAETATAIGAVAASRLGDGCRYRHSTREPVPDGTAYLPFEESHSHAVDQKLLLSGLEDDLACTDTVVFVDDELTTGKTLRCIVERMRASVPGMGGKKIIAASIIDRISGSDAALMEEAGIARVNILTDIGCDPAAMAAGYTVSNPDAPVGAGPGKGLDFVALHGVPDPRRGVLAGDYMDGCRMAGEDIAEHMARSLQDGARVRVIGTEECMYPALAAASILAESGFEVLCHATTRSPIGVCADDGYPIGSSVSMDSVYEHGRKTYLYCLDPMDAVAVVTDAEFNGELFGGLAAALPEAPVYIFSVRGGGV